MLLTPRLSKVYKQIFRFLIAGSLSAGLEIGLLITLVEHYNQDYLIANATAFIVTNIFNFILSKYWVFDRGNFNSTIEFVGFFLVALVGLSLNQFLMWILVDNYFLHYKLSKVVAIGLVVFWNFLAKKFLIFGNKKSII